MAKTFYGGKWIETVDVTPTWSAILPMLLEGWKNTTGEAKIGFAEELQRMAKLADCHVASLTNKS